LYSTRRYQETRELKSKVPIYERRNEQNDFKVDPDERRND